MNRLLVGVALVLTVVALGLAARRQTFTYVSIDGRTLRLLVSGSGPITVVFENRFGGPLENWGKVQPEVSGFARTVSYDRAGVGLSDRREDIAAESAEYKRWLDAISDGHLIVTRASGHNVAQEQPRLVVETIRTAVERTRRR